MKKASALTLCLVLTSALVIPSFVYAEGKVVRVGWYDSQFNYSDRFGRRSGYAYEYQQKIAAYTGWTYEYVEASWPDLFDMLKKGEIDLLSDVSYTKERE
ncbi:MAG: transporter substrate-binding domain-containing protein, partial [Schwartzia sp.]|nr:transporter substrate-binding domain-containing protein [Schwartzia sp. (in: firmicutes)]